MAVKSMKKSTDVHPDDCLDVCLLVPGLRPEDWAKFPMTLLAFAGYHGRKDMLDYLIKEKARELRLCMFRGEVRGDVWLYVSETTA